jgi:putative nucleotidyltransferase with HDIG domain
MTLQLIAKQDIRAGMFIHSIEGSWLDHPFWRTKFLLTDPADVEALQSSGIEGVWIDPQRSAEPRQATQVRKDAELAAEPETPPLSISQAKLKSQPRRRVSHKPCSLADEAGRARNIIENSRAAVQNLFHDVRLGNAIALTDVLPIVDEISASVSRNPSALISISRLRSADEYTYMHSISVSAMMINLARHLGLEEGMMRDIGMAGLLHDVGKLEVPIDVLNKPGRLTDEEFSIMRTHSELGYESLRRAGGVSDMALDVCLHHHEKIDGSGYPNRLNGEEITFFSKMGAVCDVYDAMTSQRSYKEPWTPAEAISAMFSWKGHFDADILTGFIRSLGIYPVGSLVRLRSSHLALVIENNSSALTKPIVRVFFSLSERSPVMPRDVDLACCLDAIVSKEQPDDHCLVDWERDWHALAAKGKQPRMIRTSQPDPIRAYAAR